MNPECDTSPITNKRTAKLPGTRCAPSFGLKPGRLSAPRIHFVPQTKPGGVTSGHNRGVGTGVMRTRGVELEP